MATEFTNYYNLDLYTDNDKPNLRDQYNGAMHKIDNQLHVAADNMVMLTRSAQLSADTSEAAKKAVEKEVEDRKTAVDEVTKNANKKYSEILNQFSQSNTELSNALTEQYKQAVKDEETQRKQNDSVLESKIKAEESARIKAIAGIINTSNLKDANIIVIGDSFLMGNNAAHGWAYYMQEALPSTARVTTYGGGQAGFGKAASSNNTGGVQGKNFSQMLDYAAQQQSSETSKITHIIAQGSGNDASSSSATIIQRIGTFVEKARSLFPNAEIVILPLQYKMNGSERISNSYINEYVAFVRGAAQFGVACPSDAFFWCMQDDSVTSTDNVHPNDAGYKQMGYSAAGFLAHGSGAAIGYVNQHTMGSSVKSNTIYTFMKGGIAYIGGNVQLNKTAANSDILFTLPRHMWPSFGHYTLGMISGSNTKNVCPVYINKNGEVALRTPVGGYPEGNSDIDIMDFSYPIGIA